MSKIIGARRLLILLTISAAWFACKGDKKDTPEAKSTVATTEPPEKAETPPEPTEFSEPFKVELDKYKLALNLDDDDKSPNLRVMLKVTPNPMTRVPVDACVSFRDKKGAEIDSVLFEKQSVERGGTIVLTNNTLMEPGDWNKVSKVVIYAAKRGCISDEPLSNQIEVAKSTEMKVAGVGKENQDAAKQPFVVEGAEFTYTDEDEAVSVLVTMRHRAEQPIKVDGCVDLVDEDGFEIEQFGLHGDSIEAGDDGLLRGESTYGFNEEAAAKIAKVQIYTTSDDSSCSDPKSASSNVLTLDRGGEPLE